MATTRKQLAFDLDTKVAEQILGSGYGKVYTDLKNFFEKEGLEKIEKSVYATKKPMTYNDLANVIKSLKKEFPFMDKLVKEMHQTSISRHHSLEDFFHYDGTAGEFAKEENKTMSMDKIKEVANQARENKSNSLNADKSISKSKGNSERGR